MEIRGWYIVLRINDYVKNCTMRPICGLEIQRPALMAQACNAGWYSREAVGTYPWRGGSVVLAGGAGGAGG